MHSNEVVREGMHAYTNHLRARNARCCFQLFSEAKLFIDCFASAAPISGQLYGRPDREPTPSPNPALNQETTGWLVPLGSQCYVNKTRIMSIMTQNPYSSVTKALLGARGRGSNCEK